MLFVNKMCVCCSPPTHSVSSSAARICAACRSACPSCGSDSSGRYRSSLCGSRECSHRISSSVFSGVQERRPGRRERETERTAPLAGVRSRYICSEETSALRDSPASAGPPLSLRTIHKCAQVADQVLPVVWAWFLPYD